jgi:hypothetical protein
VSQPRPSRKSFEISKWAVWEAYRRVKANKGAPGVDAVVTRGLRQVTVGAVPSRTDWGIKWSGVASSSVSRRHSPRRPRDDTDIQCETTVRRGNLANSVRCRDKDDHSTIHTQRPAACMQQHTDTEGNPPSQVACVDS